MGWLQSILERLWRWYVDLLVCAHFCAFRRAGSALKYTHVHILPQNPQGATGLGHDDETNNNDPAHASVSKPGGCRTQAEDDASMALRQLQYLATAYFHPAGPGGCPEGCPEGFRCIKCKCGEEEVFVCYTLDHDKFQQWYEEQSWDNRIGSYAWPYENARSIPDGTTRELDCPSSLVLFQFETKSVPTCNGFGPADADNVLIQQARANLQAAVGRITCKAGCSKQVTEIWRGWKCKPSSNPSVFFAEAQVQWRIECKP